MKVIKIIILAITLLSGCASIVRDVSTGEITAQISTRNCCFCKFIYPASGHVITVDAGRQFVVQKCWGSDSPLYEVTDGNFGTQGKDKDSFRTFYFDAKAGRKYHLSENCFKLADDDATSEDQAIDCAPRLKGRLALSSFEHSAVIIPGGTTPRQDACWPSVRVGWNESKRILVVGVDDGPTSIEASCDLPDPNSTSAKTASFVFNAEADHAYTLSGEDEECMRLVDITSEENVIACEPYHEESLE